MMKMDATASDRRGVDLGQKRDSQKLVWKAFAMLLIGNEKNKR